MWGPTGSLPTIRRTAPVRDRRRPKRDVELNAAATMAWFVGSSIQARRRAASWSDSMRTRGARVMPSDMRTVVAPPACARAGGGREGRHAGSCQDCPKPLGARLANGSAAAVRRGDERALCRGERDVVRPIVKDQRADHADGERDVAAETNRSGPSQRPHSQTTGAAHARTL